MTIFNVHGGANIAPIIAARILGVPVVWHFHETTPRFCWLVYIGKWILKKHPHRLVVVARKAEKVYGLENADFIPGAVDEKFWSRNRVSDEGRSWNGILGDNEEVLKILSVGNLNPLKGIDVLLGALDGLASPYKVKIVGLELETHAAYARSLYVHASEITALEKECTIEFIGWQEKGKIRSLLAGCDVFVLPSRSEACPIVLLEAMAMKCICVASDVGDVKNMLTDYTRGKIFPSGSAEDLRLCLGLAEIGRLKRQVIDEKTNGSYRLESISHKIFCVYNSLIPQDKQ
ncbi:MAG: glycosyltransferase family 4 protein [Gammaproteobacteria bacterium]|nr:glycosyltransferase family 4 protein [Gammaproteobacteria bacterium]